MTVKFSNYTMNLIEKLEYVVKKYLKIFIISLIALSTIIIFYNAGYKCLAIVLFLFMFGAAIFYQKIYEKNVVQLNMAVVIIGCDSGLGYSLAVYCRSLGFAVIASVLDIDGPNVNELLELGVYIYKLDITIKESIQNFGVDIRECLKNNKLVLYALINNAGLMIIGDFEWQTDDQILHQVNVNVVGTIRITKELLPLLRDDKGRIIFISSHCTVEPLPSFSIYGATKSSIRAWASALRVELNDQGIKVVCFAPGSFFLQSNIMSRQVEYFKEMEDSMRNDVWKFHCEVFKKVEQYFKNVAAYVRPQKVINAILYAVFRDAVLDKYPSSFYEGSEEDEKLTKWSISSGGQTADGFVFVCLF
ncbi:D-beta-hydroxybutyrate dehydrogenase, mitochondrial isoform X2 [Leptopilina boulardi]|uniref:D-beta-hydroxybutyrate dehydrogenase, mitochondrial isoform X2 n=1 Tax=Leptopilina boulardi TaxID=63433 RepID=UPI0021F50375|nr:D-beta-hydroxybutyrate dehydrogenase, mitochondrial isoform X2 [Leptopilina boulardi]XP_051170420.1 D-beta-hydroxybutyrate dehydrogenase, mitochondrial isoform X2 [Leptopilina boulardi]